MLSQLTLGATTSPLTCQPRRPVQVTYCPMSVVSSQLGLLQWGLGGGVVEGVGEEFERELGGAEKDGAAAVLVGE